MASGPRTEWDGTRVKFSRCARFIFRRTLLAGRRMPTKCVSSRAPPCSAEARSRSTTGGNNRLAFLKCGAQSVNDGYGEFAFAPSKLAVLLESEFRLGERFTETTLGFLASRAGEPLWDAEDRPFFLFAWLLLAVRLRKTDERELVTLLNWVEDEETRVRAEGPLGVRKRKADRWLLGLYTQDRQSNRIWVELAQRVLLADEVPALSAPLVARLRETASRVADYLRPGGGAPAGRPGRGGSGSSSKAR